MGSFRNGLCLAVLGFALACTGCARGNNEARQGKPNLVVVTLDTVRADRLGCYGHVGAATPRIDRLAAEGVTCDRSIAVAPLTLPSHASLMTGLYPPRHGVRDNGDFRLPEVETTLAEHLKTQGYHTAAVIGSVILAGNLGIAQGFDRYDEPRPTPMAFSVGREVFLQPLLQRTAGEVTRGALAALEELSVPGAPPFFLWVHYYDPHAPYTPPKPYADRFADRLYDGEIAYMDAEIGRLVDALGERGLLDRSLVVVVADHGESLGEHGEATHGMFVYDGAVRVPLILRLPRVIPEGRRYGGLNSGVDLVPTVLDLMGLPALHGVQGHSFAAGLLRVVDEAPREAVYSEAILPERLFGWAPLHALRDRSVKFIEAPEPEIYDLDGDPGERSNLAASRPAEITEWRRHLQAAMDAFGAPHPSAEQPADAERRAQLESLGYLSAGRAPGTASRSRSDPKRVITQYNDFLEAKNLIHAKRFEEARGKLQKVLEADPENPAALAFHGMVLFTLGRGDEGVRELQASARLAPGVYETQRNLANALHLSGRLPEAAEAYRAALAIQPDSAADRLGLGNVLFAQRDYAGALASYDDAIRLGLDVPPAHAARGVALMGLGKDPEAEAELRRALAADPKLGDAWNMLGVLLERTHREAEALTCYARADEVRPGGHPEGLFNHARLSLIAGDRDDTRRDLERLLREHPAYTASRYLLARWLLEAGDREGARKALRSFLASPTPDPRYVGQARGLLSQIGG